MLVRCCECFIASAVKGSNMYVSILHCSVLSVQSGDCCVVPSGVHVDKTRCMCARLPSLYAYTCFDDFQF